MEFHQKDLSELDDLTEEHLGFSALSEGLGFSKAKNAPKKQSNDDFDLDDTVQKSLASGAGAYQAGPIKFATQVAKPTPSFTSPAAIPQAPNMAPQQKIATATAKHFAAASVAPSISPLTQPAAPRYLRTAAFALDFSFVAIPFAIAWWAGFRSDSAEIFFENPKSPIGLFLAIFAGYFLLSESFGGQSLGKMIFHLRVVEDDKYEKPTGLRHAVARIALYSIGTALAGLGLLFSFKDAKKRPWHDIYSGTIVRQKD